MRRLPSGSPALASVQPRPDARATYPQCDVMIEEEVPLFVCAVGVPPLYADALARTHNLVPGHLLNMPPLLTSTHAHPSTHLVPEAHLLNAPPLCADALARTRTLVPGYLLNMPPLLTSTHAHPSTPWRPADLNTPTFCADALARAHLDARQTC